MRLGRTSSGREAQASFRALAAERAYTARMPSCDASGKPLSGATLRRRARQKRTQYAAALAEAGHGPTAADFAPVVSPPVGKPTETLAWANEVIAIAMSQAMRDPALTNPERWRWIKDFAAVLGMLRDKASEQRKVADLQNELAQLREQHAQLTAAEDERMVRAYLANRYRAEEESSGLPKP